MKRILILIENVFSYAGTENVCNFMTTCFTDCDVKIVSINGEGNTFYPFDKVSEIITLKHSKNKWTDYKAIEEDFSPDYVFVIGMGKLSVVFFIKQFISLLSQKRKYYACEHIAYDSHNSFVKFLKLIALRFYSKVIVLTERDKLRLSFFGINTIAISNPAFYKGFERVTRSYVALAVGRLEHQKGFDILIDIWKVFSKNKPHWKLKIVGDGSMVDLLAMKIKKLCLENTIELVGKSDKIDEYYKSSDVLVVTSRYEGLPMTMLEAKSWSMPIVSFDCPTGPKELIENGCDGFLVPFGNEDVFARKLCQLDDDKLYYEFVNNIRNTIKKIESSNIKSKWQSLID